MIGFSYARLNEISLKEKNNYRGDKTRFPIGARRQNNRCFYVREEDGQKVFEIAYGHRYTQHEITKEEYEALQAAKKPVREYVTTNRYMRVDIEPNVVGVVRPDNTFEFNKDGYYQGDRGFLGAYARGCFINDSRRGGMLYTEWNQIMHPIWRGMRVDCETMKPTQEYQVFVEKVNRKASKVLTAPYKDFLLTTETMLKAMSWSGFINVVYDVHMQYIPETGEEHVGNAYKKYIAIAERIKNEAPLDAAVLFMLQLDVGNLRWDLHQHMKTKGIRTPRGDETPEQYFLQMKRSINKALYRQHKEVFDRIEQPAGKHWPAGDWGVEIIVDGKEVKQYGYGV